jgi:hypothetical protein
MMRWFGIALFLVTTGSVRAQTQRDTLVTGDFVNLTFPKFAASVAAQTPYRFYFKSKVLDTLVINLRVKDKTVNAVLDQVLEGTDFHYAVDAQHHVYILEGHAIQTSLPDHFFNREDRRTDFDNAALLEALSQEKKDKQGQVEENKVYAVGRKTKVIGEGNATISGRVKAVENGEPIVGATVYIESPSIGTTTDQFGFFRLSIPKGRKVVNFKSLGMKNTRRTVLLYGDGNLDVEMQEDVKPLREVIIESEKDKNISGMQMGRDKLDIKTMKTIPVALGEVDVFKVLLTLPGVQTVGEGTTGLNVRGGSTSQNLILFDDAVIYNPSHLFGFFSAFNPDLVKNVELYKSAIPAEYGGRLSSVMDVSSREGNKKKFSGTGGIGPVTSRIVLEGPLINEKTSFLVGVRSTYSDWLLNLIPTSALSKSQASFYDVNFNVSHEIDEKNSLYLTSYLSNDRFRLNTDTVYSYGNKAATLKWKHTFGSKLFGVVSGSYSGYNYAVESTVNPINAFTLKYGIRQEGLKADFSYYPVARHTVNVGVSSIMYSLSPGTYTPRGAASSVTPNTVPDEQGRESAIYISDTYDVTPTLSLYGGLRFSAYQYLGPHDKYIYQAGQARDVSTITDTVSYRSGKAIAHYQGPEYRFTAKYQLASNMAIKVSYNRTRQYIQTLSNTAAVSPTDIWKLSDSYIKPQIGDQVSLGLYKNFRANTIEASVEGYYKMMQNAVDYVGGAQLILNHHIETDILNGKGKAYGLEFMVKKMSGKINGWVSYTYSRSLLNTPYETDQGTNTRYYPSNYDKPHAVNVIGNYKFSHRFSTSLNLTYSTGRPITVPIARYYEDGSYRVLYGPRNGSRIPDYFRMDFSMNIEGNHKVKKPAHGSWTVGVYNVTARRNAYSVFFESQNAVIKGYKLSILGTAIPTITYNFKF